MSGLTTPGLVRCLLQRWFCTALLALAVMPAAGAQQVNNEHFYTTLRGVHVAGYQGWFDCPGDGAQGVGWGHWFRGGTDANDPQSLAIDLWPDTSELGPDERCATGFRLRSGQPALLFSDQNAKTVARHFGWMRHYGIDGAAMQRFLATIARPGLEQDFDKVLANARAGAEANHRGFFVMYDLSGMHRDAAIDAIRRDWSHLTDDLHLTDSPAYIFDHGKPLVGVWGLGFPDRDVSPSQAVLLIRYLRGAGATVLGGVPVSWRNLGSDGFYKDARTEPQWAQVFRSLDVISPWTVGRFTDDTGADTYARLRLVPDIAETKQLGIEYMPVVFPGYSRHQGALPTKDLPLNTIPRHCGAFYQRQIENAARAGVQTLYTAMFDEVNEGTAIFKLTADPAQEPNGVELLGLDADNCQNATTDLYLRLAGRATDALKH